MRNDAENALAKLTQSGHTATVELLVDGKTYTGEIVAVDTKHNLVLTQFGHKTLLPFSGLSNGALADLLNSLTAEDLASAPTDYLTAGLLFAINGQSAQSTAAIGKAIELDHELSERVKTQLEQAQQLFKARHPAPAVSAATISAETSSTGSAVPPGPAGSPSWNKPAPLIATGSWAPVLKTRPRLLGGAGFLKALVATKPQAGELDRVTTMLGLGIRTTATSAPKDKVQAEIDRTLKDVASGVTNEHQDTWVKLDHAAETYDFFYEAIPAADRARIVEWMNGHLGKYTQDEGAFFNSTLSKITTYLHVAYATWGDNPRAPEFRDYALKTLYEGKLVPVLKEFGAEGGYTECGWYTRGALWNLVQGLELARRIEKTDPFQLAPDFFYHRIAYEMYDGYPRLGPEYGEERFSMEGDGAQTYGGTAEYPRWTRTILAQYFRGSPWSRYILSKRKPGTSPEAHITDMFWEESPEAATDPTATNLSLAYCASQIGKVYARDSWKDDATWFRFEAGDWWCNHQHFEAGNFEIFHNAPLATESGEYLSFVDAHSVNWLQRSIAHNTILVYQPDEKWTRMRDGGTTYANDGGQNKKFDWTVDALPEWLAQKDKFNQADLLAFQSGPDFMYVASDCTPAYSSSKLAQFVRQIVFIHPGLFVIYDHVISTRADYEKTWLLHCHNEPQIEKDLVTISAGTGKELGTLSCRTLLPDKPQIRKVFGYTYRGQNFPEPETANTPLADKWRIEVLSGAPATDDVFLHVLSTAGAAPASKLIRQGAQIGAEITTATGSVQVFFSGKSGGTLSINGRKVTLTNRVEPNKEP